MDLRERYEQRAADLSSNPSVPPASEVPGREDYGWIAFEGLQNTRDLGGLPAAEGKRVKRGLLLRSGALGFGTRTDLARLQSEYGLRVVVDLRNKSEVAEQPDPMDRLPGVRYLHADILMGRAAGISQDKASRKRFKRLRAVVGAGDLSDFFTILYPMMILGSSGIAGYRALFDELLAGDEGAVLWHCTIGRDRCGLGCLLVETALGVPADEIERDHLASNVYVPAEYRGRDGNGGASHAAFAAAIAAAEREYGGVMGYLRGALGITPGELADLRARYLEP